MDYALFVMLMALGAFLGATYAVSRVGQKPKEPVKREVDPPSMTTIALMAVVVILMVIILPLIFNIPHWLGVLLGALFIFWRTRHSDTYEYDDEEVVRPFEHPEGLSAEEAADQSLKYMLNIIRIVCIWAFGTALFVTDASLGILFAGGMLYWGYRHVDFWFMCKHQKGESGYLLISLPAWYYIIRVGAISLAVGLMWILISVYN